MQLLSSIADLKDIVNKEYIDSILADYVLSANLGALATKDSLAFSDLTSRPSKLSDFTDDVVAGKYLPLSGGTLTGVLTLDSSLGAYSFLRFTDRRIGSQGYADNILQITDAEGRIHGALGLCGNSNGVTYYYLGCENDTYNGNNFRVYADKVTFGDNTIYHAGNFNPADYLPKTGGTLTGGLTISSGNLIVSSGGGDTVTNKIYPTADNTHSLGQNGRRWSDIKTVLINGGTPIHSGNVGDYAMIKGASAYRLDIETPLASDDADIHAYFQRISKDGTNVSSSDIGSARKGVIRLSGGGSESQLLFDHYVGSVYYRNYQETAWSDWHQIAFTDSNVASADSATNAAKLGGYSITQVLPQILQTYRYIGAGTDLDTLIEENAGWWNSRDNTDYTNGPKQNFGLLSARINSAYFGQLAFGYGSSELMYRSQSYGSSGKIWKPWKTIAFTDSDITGKAASAGKLTLDNGQDLVYKNTDNGHLYVGDNNYASGETYILGNSIKLRYGASASYGFILNSSGNVTIGTTDLAGTSYALCVNGVNKFYDKDNTLKLYTRIKGCGVQIGRTTSAYTGGYNGGVTIGEDDSNLGYIAGAYNESTGSSKILFHYGGTNQFDASIFIKGISGNVGIANANPAYKLDVAGSIRTTSSLTIGTIVLTDENGTLKIAGNAYTTGQLATGEAGQAASGGGSVQYWSNEYDMDIGTDVLVSSKEYIGTNTIVGWDLAGSCLNDLYIGYDGYTIWMQGSVDEASDMRLKTVIDAVNLDIRDIAYAPIFNYVFKSRPQGRQMLGSSAQYWQAIAPKAVSENDKGNLAMNYGAIALASVVAVAKKVVTHEEEIAELKSKVQSLETRLAKYELN